MRYSKNTQSTLAKEACFLLFPWHPHITLRIYISDLQDNLYSLVAGGGRISFAIRQRRSVLPFSCDSDCHIKVEDVSSRKCHITLCGKVAWKAIVFIPQEYCDTKVRDDFQPLSLVQAPFFWSPARQVIVGKYCGSGHLF